MQKHSQYTIYNTKMAEFYLLMALKVGWR